MLLETGVQALIGGVSGLTSADHPCRNEVERGWIPTGSDIGNGHTKVVIGLENVKIPSYVFPLTGELQEVPETGWIKYIDGDRADLTGQRWLAGDEAYIQSPTNLLRVTDDARGKPEYALHLLVGAISTLPFRSEWRLNVCTSAHHRETLGAAIKEALQGVHIVRFAPDAPECVIEVNVLQVLQEGAAILTIAPGVTPSGVTLLFDFGNGTTVATQFGPKGRMIDRKVHPAGVEVLIEGISKDLIGILNREGDRQLIRRSIEDKSLRYGGRKLDISELYNARMVHWINSVVKPTYRAVEAWLDVSTAVIAVGGGVCLPNFSDALTAKGIMPLQNPTWANALGLAHLAQQLGGVS